MSPRDGVQRQFLAQARHLAGDGGRRPLILMLTFPGLSADVIADLTPSSRMWPAHPA